MHKSGFGHKVGVAEHSITEVSGPAGAPTLRTGEVHTEYTRQLSPASHSASCCCCRLVLTVWSRMHTRLEAHQDALHCSSSALPPSFTTHLPPSPTQHTPTHAPTHPHTTHPHTPTHTSTYTHTQELPFPEWPAWKHERSTPWLVLTAQEPPDGGESDVSVHTCGMHG